MEFFYFSLTGQCNRLVQKFKNPIWGEEIQTKEISFTNPFVEAEGPYVVIVPSYEEIGIREVFYDFFETGDNIANCIGMIGSGNRNFGDLYLVTALEMRELYGVPILYDVEFHGTDRDIKEIEKLLESIRPDERQER